MKLRRIPEDFQVTEQTDLRPASGQWALYRLTKKSTGTPEAVSSICRQWGLSRNRISYGGLKDRHAITSQHLSIRNGPPQSLDRDGLQLEYLGQTARPFTSAEIRSNHFIITVRSLSRSQALNADSAARIVQDCGLPNYFDDQRFGSLGFSGEWIAKEWCLKNWERALWLALADAHPDDSGTEKQQKQLLRDHWGNWPECQKQLARSHRRSIVTFLADKVNAGREPDFRGALARLNSDLRGLYLSAWQSALWNRVASGVLAESLPPDSPQTELPLQSGPAVFPLATGPQQPQLQELKIPLPSARIQPPPGLPGRILQQVLDQEQISLRQIRVTYPRDRFFSRSSRALIVCPAELRTTVQSDDLYPEKHLLKLEFQLPRGSYATLLVRRLFAEPV